MGELKSGQAASARRVRQDENTRTLTAFRAESEAIASKLIDKNGLPVDAQGQQLFLEVMGSQSDARHRHSTKAIARHWIDKAGWRVARQPVATKQAASRAASKGRTVRANQNTGERSRGGTPAGAAPQREKGGGLAAVEKKIREQGDRIFAGR